MHGRSTLSGYRPGITLILFMILITTGGCFWKKKAPEVEPNAEELYQQGLTLIREKQFDKARENFNKAKIVSTETDLELLAQVAVADSYFEEQEYEAARAQYEEIFKLHSGGDIADYLQYRIGECYFWQMDTIDRDTSNAKEALIIYNHLAVDFPKSAYLQLARLRVKEIHTFLAESEFFIGGFYLRKNAFFAAINRFKKAIELYPDSGIEDKLLYHLYKTYKALKDEDHAEEYRRILIERFPYSEYIPQLSDTESEGVVMGGKVHREHAKAPQPDPLPPLSLAGTYQGEDKGSRTRRLLLLESKTPSEPCEKGSTQETGATLLQGSFFDKIIPW